MTNLNNIGRRGVLKGAALGAATIASGSLLSRTAMGQQRGGVLRAALLGFGVVNTLDPQKAALNSDFWVLTTMFNSLVKFDSNMKIVPDLAESWTSPDANTLVFKLRHGVKFHDGSEMTSEDVKFSLDRVRDENTKSPSRSKFLAVESVDAIDKYTVRVRTKEPFVPMLAFLSNMPNGSQIVSKKAVTSMGEEAFSRKPVGTGAFKLVDWKPGEKLIFAAHKEYFEKGLPYLDGVEIPLIPEEPSGITAILGGQIDLASTAPFADVPKLEKTPGITVAKSPGLNWRATYLNINKAPFDDVNFRRAVSMAFDRQAIVDAVLFGEGRPMWGCIPSAISWAYQSTPRPLCTFNPERAKAEFAKSKIKPGTEVNIITWGAGWWKRWTEIFCAQVNQTLGVKFTPEVLDPNVAFQRWTKMEIEAENAGWIGRIEADEYIGDCFHSKGARNFPKYNNPAVDKLIEDSRKEFDQAKRGELIKKAEDLIVEDCPVIFTLNNNAHNMWTSKVKGFQHLPSQSFGSQFPPVNLGG